MCQKILRPHLLYLSRNIKERYGQAGSGRVAPGWSIVVNDSTSPELVIKIHLNFVRFFLKVLELF